MAATSSSVPYFLANNSGNSSSFADKVLHYLWMLTSKEYGCKLRMLRVLNGWEQCLLEFDLHAASAAAATKEFLTRERGSDRDAFALACLVVAQCNLLNFCAGVGEDVIVCSSKENSFFGVKMGDASSFYMPATKSAKRMDAALETRNLLLGLRGEQCPLLDISFVHFDMHQQQQLSSWSMDRINLHIPTDRLMTCCIPAFLDGLLATSRAKEEEELLLVALCMGMHKRLGKESWLKVLTEDLLYTIARVFLIPESSSRLIGRDNMQRILVDMN